MVPAFTRAVHAPLFEQHSCFLAGPLVAGQRQALIERLRVLLAAGVPGYAILVLLPDRATARRFRQAVDRLDLGPYSSVDLQTYYGLASRLVRLFWPLVAGKVGFAAPARPPVFLNYEAAQYLMGQVVEPLLAEGYFEGLYLRPQRILSQLLDNLNKAAVADFALAEVAPRLSCAWAGEEQRLRVYEQVQTCIDRYRSHCLRHGLLDASLVFEVCNRHLIAQEEFWHYFTERYRHLLVDSAEELVPVAGDLVRRLLPQCDSALLGGDAQAGFRIFLGVDAPGATELSQQCKETIAVAPEVCASRDMVAFADRLGTKLGQVTDGASAGSPRLAVADVVQTRYRGQMIEAVAQRIVQKIAEGVAPGEIAVVAPHADGVLRFLLSETFRAADIPFAIVRRYETLREEPVVRACLALAILAHPDWGLRLSLFDLSGALERALKPLDRLRAELIARHLYDPRSGQLKPASELNAAMGERIGRAALVRYEALRAWIEVYRSGAADPWDHFLRRLFGEVLSHAALEPEDAEVYSKLIASAASFRE
ncbi:MAG: hypothetical protein OXI35_09800, partial [Gemmatimonadota bacterium]|nr:hypothetical protein [Gemmatimonadota bacterium]